MKRTRFAPRVSDAQRQRNKEWRHVRRERAESVAYVCEAALLGVCDGYGVHGHHVVRDRSLNTFENCRWLCSSCHRWVHAHPAQAYTLGLLERSASARATIAPVGYWVSLPSANPDRGVLAQSTKEAS